MPKTQEKTEALYGEPWPWFYYQNYERRLSNLDVDPELRKIVEHFVRNGYAIVDPRFENFDELAQTIIDSLDYDSRFDKGRHVQEAWKYCEPVRTLAVYPRILKILRAMYQLEPIPFQTMNFRIGNPQRIHSDAIHLQTMPKGFLCAVWIALEDVDSENGPLFAYPKSHRFPMLDLHELGLGSRTESIHNYRRYQTFLEQLVEDEGLQRTTFQVKNGTAIIWAANFLHGVSPEMDGSRSRHSQITHYYFGNTIHYRPVSSDPLGGGFHIDDEVENILTGKQVPNFYRGNEGLHWESVRARSALYRAVRFYLARFFGT